MRTASRFVRALLEYRMQGGDMRDDSGDVSVRIREARVEDVPVITRFIRDIAAFEKLSNEVVATEEVITESLFGERPDARVILADVDGEPAGFAVYFFNFSTFVGRPGST